MKKIVTIALALCILFAAAGCNLIVKDDSEEQYDYPVTVGSSVFTQAPSSVVCLSANLADIILACGYEGKLSMVSDSCTQEELELLPSAGTPDSPDVDAIISVGADLVLGDESLSDEDKEELTNSGAQVMIIKPADNSENLETLYLNLASILGGSYTGRMKAMSAYDSLESSLSSISSAVGGSDVVITACYIYDVSDDQCEVAYGSGNVSELFGYVGVTNIAENDDDGYVGIDTMLTSNPDVIFCDEGVFDKLCADDDLKTLSAVTNGTVYNLPSEYLTRQGTTRVTVVDYIAAKTHSDYTQTVNWPSTFTSNEAEYEPAFTPVEGIYYTIGEQYDPIIYIEERLISLGYMDGDADDTFTEETAYAVQYFQSVNGLEVTGIADYDTLCILMSSDAQPADGTSSEVVVTY